MARSPSSSLCVLVLYIYGTWRIVAPSAPSSPLSLGAAVEEAYAAPDSKEAASRSSEHAVPWSPECYRCLISVFVHAQVGT